MTDLSPDDLARLKAIEFTVRYGGEGLSNEDARWLADLNALARSEHHIAAENLHRVQEHLRDMAFRLDAAAKALVLIRDIGEGSTTPNSLPHVARIASAALKGEEPT